MGIEGALDTKCLEVSATPGAGIVLGDLDGFGSTADKKLKEIKGQAM